MRLLVDAIRWQGTGIAGKRIGKFPTMLRDTRNQDTFLSGNDKPLLLVLAATTQAK
jgi:hypothetical protein